MFSHVVIAALQEAGVDTSGVRLDPAIKTGATVVLSRDQDRAMLTYPGSIAAVTAADLDPTWHGLARHLHVASPFLLTGLRPELPSIMRRAREAGMTVSLDPNWDPAERWDLAGMLEATDILLPNENEARAISGRSDLEGAVAWLAERVPLVVVKRGADGALAAQGDERVAVSAYRVPVVDTTGAGDTFDGGFLAAWLRGEPLRRCLEMGCACAAGTLTRLGGLNGQPTWEEALQRVLAPAGNG